MSPPNRRIALSVARFVIILGVLVAPWPGWGRIVSGAFTDVAAAVFAPLLGNEKADVAFTRAPADAAEGDWDSVVLLKSPATGQAMDGAAIDVRRVWYLPMAVLFALSLAVPVGGARGVALLLTIGLVVFPWLAMLPALSFLAQAHVFDFGSVTRVAIDVAYRALVAPLGMAYALPAFLWLLVVALMRPLGIRSDDAVAQTP